MPLVKPGKKVNKRNGDHRAFDHFFSPEPVGDQRVAEQLTGQIKQQPGPQAVLRRQAQRMNIRVQRGQKIVTIREQQQREHRGKERCASLAEPLDNRVKGINDNKRKHKPRLDKIAALVGLPEIVHRHPEQKDDHHAFDFAQLPL